MDGALLNIIASIIIGGLTGWAAKRVMRTVAEEGWALDLILGIGGGLFGGAVLNLLAGRGLDPGFNVASLVISFGGAALALGVLRFVRKPLAA
jgi:uncharacterized membrane protein YeaQ/YmgE (transglycosylase-associated protein family)